MYSLIKVQFCIALKGALPDHGMTPACFIQSLQRLLIPHGIAVQLLTPEVSSALRPPEQAALVAMPEAAMDENDSTEAGQNNIRLPGQ